MSRESTGIPIRLEPKSKQTQELLNKVSSLRKALTTVSAIALTLGVGYMVPKKGEEGKEQIVDKQAEVVSEPTIKSVDEVLKEIEEKIKNDEIPAEQLQKLKETIEDFQSAQEPMESGYVDESKPSN